MHPDTYLRKVRIRLGITIREVEEMSLTIARTEGNRQFYISNAWLSKIECGQSTPSIYKLLSLSAIYRVKFADLLLVYGVDPDKIGKYQLTVPLQKTHLTTLELYHKGRVSKFPVCLDKTFKPDKTNLLPRLAEIWEKVPIALMQHVDSSHNKWGYIGLEDYMLYPLLRPGSFVQIDDREKTIKTFPWRTELERPIYFVETPHGYACSWCVQRGGYLILVPHPSSPYPTRQFRFPEEAKIVGRVRAVAMRFVDYPVPPPSKPAKMRRRS